MKKTQIVEIVKTSNPPQITKEDLVRMAGIEKGRSFVAEIDGGQEEVVIEDFDYAVPAGIKLEGDEPAITLYVERNFFDTTPMIIGWLGLFRMAVQKGNLVTKDYMVRIAESIVKNIENK